jgi:tetratricopeptide (TPR) repeat protein
VSEEFAANLRHLQYNIGYYARERILRAVFAYGEVAAFARTLNANGIRPDVVDPPALAAAAPPAPVPSQSAEQCADRDGVRFSLDLRIEACTALINSGRLQEKDLIRAYEGRGLAYAKKNDKRALIDATEVILRDQRSARAYLNRAAAFLNEDDWTAADRAIADTTEVIKLDPKNAMAYAYRAGAYSNKYEPDRAIADANIAIGLDPKIAISYFNRGRAHADYRKKDYDRAIADFSEAIRLDPDYADAYFQRAVSYSSRAVSYSLKKDYDGAIADYSQVIGLDPNNLRAFVNRGYAYAAKGELDRALADCDEVIAREPAYINAYVAKANIFTRKGDYERAIASYSEAIRIDSSSTWSYHSRGRLYFFTGSMPKALTDLNLAVQMKSFYPANILWLDIAERRNNIPSHLAQNAKRVVGTDWPVPAIRLFLGEITPAAMIAAADKSNKWRVCEANLLAGEWALLRGAKDEARQLFRRIVSDCDDTNTLDWANANAELRALGAAHEKFGTFSLLRDYAPAIRV